MCGSWTRKGGKVGAAHHGELMARGANVLRGYWNSPEGTSRAFRDGLFHAGAIGYEDVDRYFYILDRLKSMEDLMAERVAVETYREMARIYDENTANYLTAYRCRVAFN